MSAALIRGVSRSLRTRVISAGQRRQASGHGPEYNEPGGYLFGEKPTPGVKRVKEDWERPYLWGMTAAFLITAVGLYYKPSNNISDWAYREAQLRLQERGEMPEYTSVPRDRA
ncbi:ESSS subunit of NADH:ubiquinone oxidoreductase-domain-containing protein [Thamnocephalis sphaerospora]|uniref:NADH dehydrogenase [ubiquinone] 1 beta subcomplex subunit 11, mitochondrial n=1 Tax=Thamnocephalis sphaerospora TaxID=78915 RepID=A0A4P9XHH2_9FUNG|nr:ESSS subunit of NADH:ubiquinone oxidoreductase-domain-containing protein [Thamnocephalis sphaerospora]|eukprot:RKP04660.1 ESSS subunit of NADH:ubiquinone oxidoreductase-domain-containing protein [Thamnocephalis sphaerospora]